MWEPIFLINTIALGIALVANFCFLVYLVLHARRKTGLLAILFSSVCTTLFILLAFVELFLPLPIISYSVVFFGVLLLMSYTLIALLVPDKRFNALHTGLLAFATVMAIFASLPGMVYQNIIPTNDGYVELIPGPYAWVLDLYVVGIIAGTLSIYLRRIAHEKINECRIVLKILMKSFTVYIIGFVLALFILPSFGINFFTNLVLAFSMSVVIGTFAVIYAQEYARTHDKTCVLT